MIYHDVHLPRSTLRNSHYPRLVVCEGEALMWMPVGPFVGDQLDIYRLNCGGRVGLPVGTHVESHGEKLR